MEQMPEEIIQSIMTAFKGRELPEGDPIFLSHSSEVDTRTIERLAHQTTWENFPHAVICKNPLALAFMTPNAFAWLLPAYLVMSVALYSETDTLTTSIITCLTPPDEADAYQFEALAEETRALNADLLEEDLIDSLGADDELLHLFMERAAVLTQNEKAAVRDYLEYVDAAHGTDFPVFGPKQALNRYWVLN